MSRHTTAYERSPVDVLRLAVGVGLLVALLVIMGVFGNSVVAFVDDLLRGVDALPQWMVTTLVVGVRILAAVLLIAGLVAALTQRRWRLLLTAGAAGLVAAIAETAVHAIISNETQPLATVSTSLGPVTNAQFPSGAGVAMLAAAATATAPWVPRRWRRLTWTLVIATAVARFVTAPTSFDSAIALLVGWVAGSLALVVAGGPVRRPTDAAVADGLASVGVPVSSDHEGQRRRPGVHPVLRHAPPRASGSSSRRSAPTSAAPTCCSAPTAGSRPHDLGDERSFSSLRRTVEHEALVALTARDLGVRTPHIPGLRPGRARRVRARLRRHRRVARSTASRPRSSTTPCSGVDLGAGRRSCAGIGSPTATFASPTSSGPSDGQVWLIDFGFSELAASDLLLSTDLAELLASTSLVVGCDRAVAAGVAAVAPEPLASAASRLHPFALSGATRAGLKEQPGLLEAVRSRVEELAAAPAGARGS